MKRYMSALILTIFHSFILSAQDLPASLKALKSFAINPADTASLDSFGHSLFSSKGINYLAPVVARLIKPDSLNRQNPFQAALDMAFINEYKMSLRYEQMGYDSMPLEAYRDADIYVDTMKAVSFDNAARYILSRTGREKIVMINEVPYKPQHRVFVASLLDSLYQQGFRYLAIEIIGNGRGEAISKISMLNGWKAAEPISGELIRMAMGLGFKVIPYEDQTPGKYTPTGRAAMEAQKIADIIRKDSSARILVLSGITSASEKILGEQNWPMAYQLKRFTGHDPLTIDQTELTEGSNFEYGRYFYEKLADRIQLKEAMIAFRKDNPVSLLDNDHYDLQVIHPRTGSIRNRPSWIRMNNNRKEFAIRPTLRNMFMVQGYYSNEYSAASLPFLIPADQTVSADIDGYYYLYLKAGKYILVYRDMNYQVLSIKEITVM